MVTTSFIKGKIVELQTKIAAASENPFVNTVGCVDTAGYMSDEVELQTKIAAASENPFVNTVGCVDTAGYMSDEDLLECLEYALQHKNDIDEGYKVFAILTRTLYEDFLKIANDDIADGEKIIEIGEIIQNLNFYEAAKKAASTQKKSDPGEFFDLPRGWFGL